MEIAIFTDCKALVEKFAASGKFNFKSFCAQWKTMMFQHIFSVQPNYTELIQTTATALHIATKIASGDEKFEENYEIAAARTHRQIGGIFLMYAIYFKQPTEQYVKINVSLDMWNKLRAFVDTLPETPATDDVRYIYYTLLQSNAFRFTALDCYVGLEDLVDYNKVVENEVFGAEGEAIEDTNLKLKDEFLEFTSTQQIIPALVVLEDGYNEMKEILSTNERANTYIPLPNTTIFNDIKQSFANIQKITERVNKIKKNTIKPNENMGSKRRCLKHMAYQTRESEEEFEDSTDENTSKDTRLARRMSARTVFAEELPQDMLEDLEKEADETEDSGSAEYENVNNNHNKCEEAQAGNF